MPEANIMWFAELFTHMLAFYCVRDTLASTTGTTQATPIAPMSTSVTTPSSSYVKPIIQPSTTLSQPSPSATPHNSDPSSIKSVEYNKDSARTRQMLEARMRPISTAIATTATTSSISSSNYSNFNASYSQPPPKPPNLPIPLSPTTTTNTAASHQVPPGAATTVSSLVNTNTQPPPPPPLPGTPQVINTTTQPVQFNRKSATPSSTPHSYTHPSYTATPHTSHTNHTPLTSSSSDPYYLPSLAFPGIHQFFYRYILLLHTHTTFSMHLKDALLSSIDTLCDISWEHIDMLDLFNTISTSYTSHTPYNTSNGNMSNSNGSMQKERISYTHHILKLKLLGRFLGVAEFSHRWNSSSGSAHIQPTDSQANKSSNTHTNNNNSSNKNKMKRSTGIACLPLKQYLLYAYKTSNLCLYIPWIIEFLRMTEWDWSNGCLYAYIEVLGLLKGIQCSVGFRLPLEGSGTGTGTGVGHGAAMMSSNRYVHFHTVCYVMLLIYMRICHN